MLWGGSLHISLRPLCFPLCVSASNQQLQEDSTKIQALYKECVLDPLRSLSGLMNPGIGITSKGGTGSGSMNGDGGASTTTAPRDANKGPNTPTTADGASGFASTSEADRIVGSSGMVLASVVAFFAC